MATGRISINLPQASASKVEKPENKTIDLAADGTLYFDGSALSKDDLQQRLATLPASTSFLLRADRALVFQQFIDVADMLKRHNFTKVAIQTRTMPSPR